MHAAVQSTTERTLLRSPNSIPISVTSPQFLDSKRLYSYSWTPRPALDPEYAHPPPRAALTDR